MLNDSLKSMFNDYKPMNKPTITVAVDFTETELVPVLAKKLKSEFERMAPYASHSVVSELTCTDIEKYLKTLTWLRVCKVLSSTSQSHAYKALERRLAIPVLYAELLLCIGRAYDSQFNLEFVPAYSISEDDLLSADEMEVISSLFRQFESAGMKVVYGLPRKEEGDLDFMAMSHVSDEVISYRSNSHPVAAFFAAFFRQKQLNEVTGMMSRVVYGYESDFRYQIDALFDAMNRGCGHDC